MTYVYVLVSETDGMMYTGCTRDLRKRFDHHLLFYMEGHALSIERVMHGARDLPNRLLEDPET